MKAPSAAEIWAQVPTELVASQKRERTQRLQYSKKRNMLQIMVGSLIWFKVYSLIKGYWRFRGELGLRVQGLRVERGVEGGGLGVWFRVPKKRFRDSGFRGLGVQGWGFEV